MPYIPDSEQRASVGQDSKIASTLGPRAKKSIEYRSGAPVEVPEWEIGEEQEQEEEGGMRSGSEPQH